MSPNSPTIESSYMDGVVDIDRASTEVASVMTQVQ